MFHSNCSMVTWRGLSATRGHGWLFEDHTASEALITQAHQLTKHFPSPASPHRHIRPPDATLNLKEIKAIKDFFFFFFFNLFFVPLIKVHINESQAGKSGVERTEINENIQQNNLVLWTLDRCSGSNFICCNSALLHATSDPSGKHMQSVHTAHWSIPRKPKRMIAPWQCFC